MMRAHKKERTRQRILQAAKEQFLQFGTEAASLDLIAEQADVSRATLFNYFNGKASLLEALGQELDQRMTRMVNHYRSRPQSSAERIHGLFEYTDKVLLQTVDLTRLLLASGTRGEVMPGFMAACLEWAEAAQAASEWRTDVAAHRLAEWLYSALSSSVLGWLQPGAGAVNATLLLSALQRPAIDNQPVTE